MIESEFQAVFEQYKDPVYRYVWRMTNSPDAAEDITQEVFLTLLRQLARSDATRGQMRPYLLIGPVHVAAYIENLQKELSRPSVKQALAAIRMVFDYLVLGQVVPVNPRRPSAVRNTRRSAARLRCFPRMKPSSSWTASTPRRSAGSAIALSSG